MSQSTPTFVITNRTCTTYLKRIELNKISLLENLIELHNTCVSKQNTKTTLIK